MGVKFSVKSYFRDVYSCTVQDCTKFNIILGTVSLQWLKSNDNHVNSKLKTLSRGFSY